jgi:hypothetical protein
MPPAAVAAHCAAAKTSALMAYATFRAESAGVADFTFVTESSFAGNSTLVAEFTFAAESCLVAEFRFMAEFRFVAEFRFAAEGAFVRHSGLGHRCATGGAEPVLAMELGAAERVAAESEAAVREVVVPLTVDDMRAVEFVEAAEVPMDLVVAPVEAAP